MSMIPHLAIVALHIVNNCLLPSPTAPQAARIMESFCLFFLVLVSGLLAGTLGDRAGPLSPADPDSFRALREDVLVSTQYGSLKGTTTKSTSGRTIYSFKKVPFAQPPLGPLRFAAPQPLAGGWGDEVYDATPNPPSCPQFLTSLNRASEDCLFLSVHTPMHPNQTLEKLPVMVYIYGGGFVLGDSIIYGPNRLLNNDVILVVPHYRLGALGFLSTQDEVVPGNNGLKDQVQALKWVQENIADFGGDPARVTIFGESAGSASVLYLTISPLAQGLFSKVIAQSGTPLSVWARDNTPVKSAHRFAQSLDCPINSSAALVECLRTKPWEALAITTFTNLVEDLSSLRLVFEASAPVVEPDLPGAFLSREPLALFKEGAFPNVPVMLGAVQHEGSAILAAAYALNLRAGGNLENPEYVREELVPTLLKAIGVDETVGTGAPISQSLALAFLPGPVRDNFTEITTGLVDMLSVAVFKASILRTADLLSRKSDVYLYSFERYGVNSLWTLIFDLFAAIGGTEPPPIQSGIMHADDLQFLFPLPMIITGKDREFSDLMCRIWTNFAITGVPVATDDTSIPSWVPYTVKGQDYYKLDFPPTAETDYTASWRKGYPAESK